MIWYVYVCTISRVIRCFNEIIRPWNCRLENKEKRHKNHRWRWWWRWWYHIHIHIHIYNHYHWDHHNHVDITIIRFIIKGDLFNFSTLLGIFIWSYIKMPGKVEKLKSARSQIQIHRRAATADIEGQASARSPLPAGASPITIQPKSIQWGNLRGARSTNVNCKVFRTDRWLTSELCFQFVQFSFKFRQKVRKLKLIICILTHHTYLNIRHTRGKIW